MGEVKNSYTILVGNPDRKNPFRRPRHRWDGNTNMDLKKGAKSGINTMPPRRLF
jgi:hypothetical protein